ncbi:NYN domain-containing protein [Nocardioides marmoribigeumensis]|uniref:Uncharacterized LabA/DUF88 family protein n=1 Tax=Nocardioides marmoribigeumensis TaxID=433649 RepID=A0ABU2BYM8_9ACTN|nr:NYN domain-containing protein [Nocardioides marmoribigeumensis]MDR7363510.1 uncharacterized LabA/DUF88 family protein [Nocardioides marmoribigeumensis]
MRSHSAVYVDVGYLLASSATRVTGTSLRSGVEVDHRALIEAIMEQAAESSGLPVLRVNWYDSGGGRGGTPDREQEQIGLLPRVKLRLGRLSHSGEQKGVDLKIGLDLVTHARNSAVDVMFLLSGDDDLTEAVEEAQAHGIEVVLLAVPGDRGKPHAVSKHLLRAADRLELIDEKAIDAAVTTVVREMFQQPIVPYVPDEPGPDQAPAKPAAPVDGASAVPAAPPAPAGAPSGAGPDLGSHAGSDPVDSGPKPPTPALMPRKLPAPAPPAAPVPPAAVLAYQSTTGRPSGGWFESVDPQEEERLVDEVCASVLESWARTASEEARGTLLRGEPTIPSEIDRALLVDLSNRLGIYALDEPTRHILRSRFWVVASAKLRET